jgi:hypothetical protein
MDMNTTTSFASPAEEPRLRRLARAVPAPAWIAVVGDGRGDVAAAAATGTAPVLAVAEGNPLPVLQELQASGLRARVQVMAGDLVQTGLVWTIPLALLCLPARHPALRAVFPAWARHVRAPGQVLFYGGLAPHPRALAVAMDHWIPHMHGEGLFLLTRRPHG